MSAEEQRAAAARAQADEISDVDLQPPSPTAAGIDPGGGADAMTIQQPMSFLAQQNQMMVNMMTMMQHDRPDAKPKGHLANVKLGERNFRSLSPSSIIPEVGGENGSVNSCLQSASAM